MSDHPSHRDQLARLNRARGQLDAVTRMIDEGRYCIDILTQLRAARSALRAV
jgi:DNA-binding FrmR family transcriptional regulator